MARSPQLTREPRSNDHGFMLIVVMIFAALLASILVGVMRMSSSYIYAAAAYSDAVRADELGRSSTDLVAQRVLLGDATARRGGAFGVRLPDAFVSVSYISESSRLDVNTTQPELLVALMNAAGVDPAQAKAAGIRINAWFTKNNPITDQNGEPVASPTQTPATTTSASPTLGIQGAAQSASPSQTVPLHHLDHVWQCVSAWGLPQNVFLVIEPFLTVSNPTGKVDPTLASPLIIQAVLGDEQAAHDYLRRRGQGFATEQDALMPIPLGARGYVGFTPGAAFRALIRVRLRDRVARRYETTVVPPKKRGDVVQVTDWHAL
jgi:Type II secretion system (T2SS), protein K